mmetsp:Transcript_3322/g.8403  ORF Transcript_3322/g.8403 Transcript_3322/m.8403 type:complete len:224 (-) Transcript_3322:127-798(-)
MCAFNRLLNYTVHTLPQRLPNLEIALNLPVRYQKVPPSLLLSLLYERLRFPDLVLPHVGDVGQLHRSLLGRPGRGGLLVGEAVVEVLQLELGRRGRIVEPPIRQQGVRAFPRLERAVRDAVLPFEACRPRRGGARADHVFVLHPGDAAVQLHRARARPPRVRSVVGVHDHALGGLPVAQPRHAPHHKQLVPELGVRLHREGGLREHHLPAPPLCGREGGARGV